MGLKAWAALWCWRMVATLHLSASQEIMYLIKWAGEHYGATSWELASNILGSKLLPDWEKKKLGYGFYNVGCPDVCVCVCYSWVGWIG